MAINENNSLPSKHCCYVAASGNGKGVAIKFLGQIPTQPNLMIFDPYNEYKFKKGNVFSGIAGRPVFHFYDRASFARAAIAAWQSKKPFRIAYAPPQGADRDEMLWFAQLAWDMADGNRRLDVLFSELARLVTSAGKESSALGECFTGGRKFGLVCHADFQSSAEIPKTIWKNTPNKVIGGQEAMLDAKRMSDELSAPIESIVELGIKNAEFEDKLGRFSVLHYLVKKAGIGNYQKATIDLRAKPPAVRYYDKHTSF